MSHLIDQANAETAETPRRKAREVFTELVRTCRQATFAKFTLMQAADPSKVYYFDNALDGQTETARSGVSLVHRLDAEAEALIAEYKSVGGTQQEIDILFEEIISPIDLASEKATHRVSIQGK